MNMNNIKAILFDFDGTLVNTAPGILTTMREVFRRMDTPVPSNQAMSQTIGLPLSKALGSLGGYNEEKTRQATSLYRELFERLELGNMCVFEHVREVLNTLKEKGFRMAIVTSRDEYSLDLILKTHHLEEYFETRVTGSAGLKAKPAPDMVLHLLKTMGITSKEALIIGDTTFDIGMGKNAGAFTCAVTWGNHTEEQLMTSQPDIIISDIRELKCLKYIDEHFLSSLIFHNNT